MAIRHLRARPPADPRVDAVRRQLRRDFGLAAEPVMLHRAEPEILAGAWIALRETLVVGSVPRRRKERVAIAISESNRCPYCIDAHRIVLAATREESDDDREIAWARATAAPGAAILASAPFSVEEGPELRGTAFCFHYINRMVTALLGDSPIPFRGWLRRPVARLSSHVFARALRRGPRAGESLAFLPPAPLPSPLAWAGDGDIAAALSRFVAAVERAAARALDAPSRERIAARLADWRGETPPGDALTAALDGVGSPKAKLALLAAIAAHRIGETEIAAARGESAPGLAGDAAILACLSFGSLRAALRIAEWI